MLLEQFASAILSGSIRIVDLTQTLNTSTPVIQLPPQFAPSNPFSIRIASTGEYVRSRSTDERAAV